MAISVTDPIGRAISRAKLITFQPFDLGKWFTFGFVAFLATLDEGGGGANFQGGGGGGPGPVRGPGPATGPTTAPFDEVRDWISSHLAGVILIGLLVVLLVLAMWLVLLWLSSRGKFMFIEGIANDTYEVKAPWKRYKPLGDSLFKFRAVLGAIGYVVVLVVLGTGLLLAWPSIRDGRFGGGAVAAILLVVFTLLPVGIALGLIDWVTTTFVVHIMYATGQTVRPAWAEFRQNVMRGNVGTLVLFLLMQIVLSIGVGIGRALLGCVTCCIGFLPYLSSVIALPLLVFQRAYTMYFVQQFSPRYVVIREAVPPAFGFPVYPDAPAPPPPPVA
jgi:hypothetical protein